MTRGWWRRNVWGLVLVVPLATGLFALNADAIYDRNFASLPKRSAPVDGTGKAVLDDYAVRVVEVVQVDNTAELTSLLSSTKAPLPTTVKVWRAILSFGGPEDISSGCEVELLDGRGRAYISGPSELAAGRTACYPDDSEQPSPFLTTAYFLLPTESRPAAIRVIWPSRLPRYIVIPVSTGPAA
jgi:hypothetical protein